MFTKDQKVIVISKDSPYYGKTGKVISNGKILPNIVHINMDDKSLEYPFIMFHKDDLKAIG